MNAAELATNLETASKIATVVNCFKRSFPDAKSDLKPWANDPDTREQMDPESIDIGFHFPGWSRRFQCRSVLVQIRFYKDPDSGVKRSIGVELAGFSHAGKQWWMSTIESWTFEGNAHPAEDAQENLKTFCRELLQVFNGES
ncbi:MAG: hypothetical protein B0A82_27125 [Alkalinema sp. CACIAM 70d]|nr:MAG: hypothetical protein B0A82_27125 [Alkalinema sp. CACIAM 70d]